MSEAILGTGPEGTVSEYADMLNALEDAAGNGLRPELLRRAGRTIMLLERQRNAARANLREVLGGPGVVCGFTEGWCNRRDCLHEDTCKARDATELPPKGLTEMTVGMHKIDKAMLARKRGPDFRALVERAYKMMEAAGYRVTPHDTEHNHPIVAWMSDAREALNSVPHEEC